MDLIKTKGRPRVESVKSRERTWSGTDPNLTRRSCDKSYVNEVLPKGLVGKGVRR